MTSQDEHMTSDDNEPRDQDMTSSKEEAAMSSSSQPVIEKIIGLSHFGLGFQFNLTIFLIFPNFSIFFSNFF